MPEQLSEWARLIDSLQADGGVPELIVDSWRRSEAAGVDRGTAEHRVVAEDDLRHRLDINRNWLHIARGHVEWLSQAIKQIQHVVYVTDRDGIVLYSASVGSMREDFCLIPGSDWSEATMGTNGAGTALVAGTPVAVVGPQHFKKAFGDCTCTAAPIKAPDESVIGALDISTSAADSVPERLFVVAHAAYSISRGIALRETQVREGATEERLLAALAASDAGTFRWNPRSDRFIDCDESLERLFGFSAGDRVETAAQFLSRIHSEDRARVLAAVADSREGTDVEMEFRVVLPDGSTRWLFHRAKMVPDPSTGFSVLVGACIDITKRKAAEDALIDVNRRLAASEGRLVTALDAAALGVWEHDAAAGRLQGDERWAEILGIPAGSVLTMQGVYNLVHPDDRDRIRKRFGSHITDADSFAAEHRVVRPDGSTRWVAVRGRAVGVNGEGSTPHFLGTMMDITEQQRSRELLREALDREREVTALLDAIYSAAPIGLGFWDRDLRFRRVNARLAEMNGLAPEDHIGRRPDELLREIEGLPEIMGQWQQVIETGVPIYNVEVRGRTNATEGERIWLEDFFPVRVDDRIIGLGAVVEDVTAHRRTEEALREADRAKDEFLAVLGHELRNPLAPLRSGLDLLKHAGDNPKLIGRVRPMMDRQLSHLVRLVDDLLDVSRITRGSIKLQRGPLDLNAAVEAAVEQLTPAVKDRRHSLIVELSDAPLPVDGDIERLTEVVSNLLSNAAKYTPPGGTIRIVTEREQAEVVLRVADTGYGIPPEGMGRLFRLFSQLPEHRSQTGGGGLGIGLALCRQLIELHGGSIEAQSAGLGRGSTFVVRLPALDLPGDVEPCADTDGGGIRPRRVLVVDDNADAAEGLRMLLELEGHDVRAVQDGKTAVAEMDAFAPEVVLLDLDMPGMDGIEVARQIRRRFGRQAVHLLAVTGWGQADDRRRTAEAEFDAHLTKPVEWRQLTALLQALDANAPPR